MLVITFSLGTQIGGIAGRNDPMSGHPVLPHIYAPFAEWGWCVALAHDHVKGAGKCGIGCDRNVDLLFYAHGAAHSDRFLPWPQPRSAQLCDRHLYDVGRFRHDASQSYSSFTRWGSGGMMDRAEKVKKKLRKSFAIFWELRRGVVEICLLYFSAYQVFLGTVFHTQRTVGYTVFTRTCTIDRLVSRHGSDTRFRACRRPKHDTRQRWRIYSLGRLVWVDRASRRGARASDEN